jgi:hypothetical protein
LQTQTDNTFQHSDALGLNNPHFGQSPVIADLNNDGKPDVLWLNMNGTAKAFLNRSTANFFAISINDSASLLGTLLRLDMTSGENYTREVVISTGMLTDQTPNIVFGLGEDEQVKRLSLCALMDQQKSLNQLTLILTYHFKLNKCIATPINMEILLRYALQNSSYWQR